MTKTGMSREEAEIEVDEFLMDKDKVNTVSNVLVFINKFQLFLKFITAKIFMILFCASHSGLPSKQPLTPRIRWNRIRALFILSKTLLPIIINSLSGFHSINCI